MPIKDENKNRYPANWQQIRKDALRLANWRCEECMVADRDYGYRTPDGEFVSVPQNSETSIAVAKCLKAFPTNRRLFRIVLTVHHVDEQPENNDPNNLNALCQKCHLDKHRGRKPDGSPELFEREEGA